MVNLKKLAQLRKEKGLTQMQVSEVLGFFTQQAYSLKETGQRDITADELHKLAQLFAVPVEELYTEDTAGAAEGAAI